MVIALAPSYLRSQKVRIKVFVFFPVATALRTDNLRTHILDKIRLIALVDHFFVEALQFSMVLLTQLFRFNQVCVLLDASRKNLLF